MKYILSLVFAFSVFLNSYGSTTPTLSHKDSVIIALNDTEKQLNALFLEMDSAQTDAIKLIYNDSIKSALKQVLQYEESFKYPFSKLNRMGTVMAYDKSMRVFSWNIVLEKNYGYEALFVSKEGRIDSLSRISNLVQPDEKAAYHTENWYGCLYYQIVPYKVRPSKEKVYLLCGWSQFKPYTQFKVLDVVSWNQQGRLQLGWPLFKIDDRYEKKRIVFEYYWQVKMYLDYDKRKKRIVFDHLSPLKKTGPLSQMWGPDMSVDCFKRKRKGWYFQEDIKIKNR